MQAILQIAIFDAERGELGVCNLGDSGLCILRRGPKSQMSAEFKTSETVHFFNCPYQLSRSPPPQVLAKMFGIDKIANGKGLLLPSQDEPSHGECYDLRIEEGDLILMSSDGLWDNLWPSEIASLCSLTLAPLEALILHDPSLATSPRNVARAMAEAALFRR